MSRLVASLLLVALLGGCAASIPESALRLPESTLEVRSIQTRTLEAPSEIDILTATIAVLQDMEFNIDRIEKDQEQALLDYVAQGGGFVPLHCATYCFRTHI